MADFLEERLDGGIQYGSSWSDDYVVNIVQTSGGQEYRSLVHPFPIRKFDVTFMMDNVHMWANLVNTYHRAHGKYSGFRAKCLDEYTSNIDGHSTPTAVDQPMGTITPGLTYQLRKYYGFDKVAGAAGYPYRNIYKPVESTVVVAAQGNQIPTGFYTVDHTTGQVTFLQRTLWITGISKSATAVISTASTNLMAAGQSVVISGCLGMTQINGLRGTILSSIYNTSITVDIDSTLFDTWTSGGTATTHPLDGEETSAGFEFDFPVRFNSNINIGQNKPVYRDLDNIELVELINP